MTPEAMSAARTAALLTEDHLRVLVRTYCGPGPEYNMITLNVFNRRIALIRPPLVEWTRSVDSVRDLEALGLIADGALTPAGLKTLRLLAAWMLLEAPTP